MAGLLIPGPSRAIRQSSEGLGAIAPGVSIKHDDEPIASPYDDPKPLLRVVYDDGSIEVSLDGSKPVEEDANPPGWFDNLAEKIDPLELARIADDLLRGVADDLESRSEWIEERAQGIKLLGLKIELPNLQSAADGAPVEGMSKVRHPILQEAVLRFQANARSELLPTDGPVKVRNDDNNADTNEDSLANQLESDFNHYLTVTATEYIPDTDKMLLMLGFGGTSFKKVYFCPLRQRPVSESVDADDLIVNNSATDLANARRVTHRIMMRPSTVKRMQILEVYRDVSLATPKDADLDAAQQAKRDQQGIQTGTMRPEDRDREIYECYCELDIKGFEHKYKGKESGLEIPYVVTLDVSSREVLSVIRNYDEDTKALPEARVNFAKYTFVPGLGFYDIGLLHILGNTTNAVTAAWRELLDAGMYSNFPGFLMMDTGARQNTNIFRVPPGGGQLVKTGGLPINQAVMPLPYSPPNQALMALVQDMAQTGQRVGGTSEMQVGEGRPDAPVGTTLAMIEQAVKVLNAVHKRMHAAQAEEFRLLARCFKEHPESFWQKNKKPARQWDEAAFRQALDNCELTPQADPNTASHGQRIMKIMALKQLQSANPSLYDPIAIDRAALQAIGWANPQQFFAPPQAQAAPPPELQQMQAEMQAKQMDSQAKMITAQAKAQESQAKIGAMANEGLAAGGQVDTPVDRHLAESERMKAQAHMTVAQAKAQAELMNAESRQQEIKHKTGATLMEDAQHQEAEHNKLKVEAVRTAKEVLMKHAEDRRTAVEAEKNRFAEHVHHDQDLAHEARENAVDRQTEGQHHALDLGHQAVEGALGRQAEGERHTLDLQHQQRESEAGRAHEARESAATRTAHAAEVKAKARTAAKPKPKPKGGKK